MVKIPNSEQKHSISICKKKLFTPNIINALREREKERERGSESNFMVPVIGGFF